MGDRGIPMVFVGYADNHSWDCYRMWNPSTSKITESRDVIWLHRMYYQVDLDDETAIMPEIRMELNSVPADMVKDVQAATASREAGGVDPVTDETEVENEFAEIFKKEDEETVAEEDSKIKDEDNGSETQEGEDDAKGLYVTRYGRTVQPRYFYTDLSMRKDLAAAEIRMEQYRRDYDQKS